MAKPSPRRGKEDNPEIEVIQAGGHGDLKKGLKKGTLVKPTSKAEADFYEHIGDYLPAELLPFTPKCFSISETDGKSAVTITLEDLTHGMARPCVMDLKMGRTTIAPGAHLAKKMLMTAKDKLSTTHDLGFRLAGARFWNDKDGEYTVYSNSHGARIHASDMQDELEAFFNTGSGLRVELIKKFRADIKIIKKWFAVQKKWGFVGNSLLFVYDASSSTPKYRLAMIDFAHVYKSDSIDDGYLFGLQNIKQYLKNIITVDTNNDTSKKGHKK